MSLKKGILAKLKLERIEEKKQTVSFTPDYRLNRWSLVCRIHHVVVDVNSLKKRNLTLYVLIVWVKLFFLQEVNV